MKALHALLSFLYLANILAKSNSAHLPYFMIRAAQPGDLVGNFTLLRPTSSGNCPNSIEHRGYNQTNNPLVVKLPHGQIKQDGVGCENYAYLTAVKDKAILEDGLIGDEEADARDNIKEVIKKNSLILMIGKKLQNEKVEFWALLEFQTRICGNQTTFRSATGGIIFKESNKDVQIDIVGNFEKGNKYILMIEGTSSRICSYKGEGGIVPPEDLPKPLNSPTPSPVASPPENLQVPESPGPEDDSTTLVSSEVPDDDRSESTPRATENLACFPADATVESEDGSVKRMDELAIGDRVRVGAKEFSSVFMFTHSTRKGHFEFVRINTISKNTLHLSRGHYLYVNGHLVAARRVIVGDFVRLASGHVTMVSDVSCERRRGLYNPQTMQGDIVVSGIVASTYTEAVDPKFAHAFLAPLRLLYGIIGWFTTLLENGGGALTYFIPRGLTFVL